jgi:hypothetical protein
VLRKWQIAVQNDRAHIIVLTTITKAQIDQLVEEIVAGRAGARESTL